MKSNEVLPQEEAQSPNTEAKVEVEVEVRDEPSLDDPAVGKPISHDQIVHLWKQLKTLDAGSFSLESLLRGARVYTPPPPPKPEQVCPGHLLCYADFSPRYIH